MVLQKHGKRCPDLFVWKNLAPQVLQTLIRVGKLQGVEALMRPILGCDSSSNSSGNSLTQPVTASCHSPDASFGYRNKIQLTYSSQCWLPDQAQGGGNSSSDSGDVVSRPVLGLLRPGSAEQVLAVTDCQLVDPVMQSMAGQVEELCAAQGLLPFNDPSGKVSAHMCLRAA